jgi:hypothetical protein
MRERLKRIGPRLRSRGKWVFVLVMGAYWGLFVATISTVFSYVRRPDRFEPADFWVRLLIFFICGIGWALCIWYFDSMPERVDEDNPN